MNRFTSILLSSLFVCSYMYGKGLTEFSIKAFAGTSLAAVNVKWEKEHQVNPLYSDHLPYLPYNPADHKFTSNSLQTNNRKTLTYTDTIHISISPKDTLKPQGNDKNTVLVKENKETRNTTDIPSRKAYEGFIWKKISGAGLSLWVQENDNIQLIPDESLPGILMIRKKDNISHRLIQVFKLPNHDINDVIKTLEKTSNWDKQQTCQFKEIQSGRKKVKRFIMVPDGEYAEKIKKQMKSEPIPAPCNGWGVGNSGSRYFEIHEDHPDKAIFIEIGQDAPLFDENSIIFY